MESAVSGRKPGEAECCTLTVTWPPERGTADHLPTADQRAKQGLPRTDRGQSLLLAHLVEDL